jgi:hypothetical protein
MQNGGKRPGAGRKKAAHTIETEAMRAFIVNKVRENLEPLLSAKLDLALGVLIDESHGQGEPRVYREAPDGNAIQYLLNQSIGKPTEHVDVTTKGKALPAAINIIKPDEANEQ